MNYNPALDTIKKVGVGELCHTDGCMCLNFSIHQVHVDVACRKSSGSVHGNGGTTIRVYSHSMDYDEADDALRAVGEEVARQMAEWNGGDPKRDFVVLLEEYK